MARTIHDIGGVWQLRLAQAPWFNFCRGTCRRELGYPDLEVVACRPDTFDYYCLPCVTEIIRAAELAELDTRAAT